ncbi:MAG TPA: HlyD family efflux transporter periplasmic adaptor subunit, partial [Ktedonobacterales bacterium]
TGSGTFITLVDLSSLQVVASVDEVSVVSMKAGQPVAFTVRAYPARLFRGAVVAVSPLAQSTSNRVTYPVIIDVDMQSAQEVSLLPGMAASVTITTAQRYNVIVIPTTAISYAHSQAAGASTGSTVVTARAARTARAEAQQLLAQLQASGAVVASDNPTPDIVLVRVKGRLVIKPVVLGLTDGKNYEVLAGLSAGEQVVTGAHAG